MTLFGRDMSDFDTSESLSGLSFLTHKATEGTSVTHAKLAYRLNAGRTAGIPVLGAYHVPRTPGNGDAGSVAAQAAFYLRYLDQQVPWWRDAPHWMHQVDLELWTYDHVSPATGRAFALALANADPGRFIVTYASRGQYGNGLANWPTLLWNADYRGSSGGSYPGDGWVTSGGASAGWCAYSGQVPAFLQYTSTPYDKNAYRGTLDQLLTLTRTGGTQVITTDDELGEAVNAIANGSVNKGYVTGDEPPGTDGYGLHVASNNLRQVRADIAALAAELDAVKTAVTALPSTGGAAPSDTQVNNAVLAALKDPTVIAGIAAALAGHLHVE